MTVELHKRDVDLLSDILADYLDNIAEENIVVKQCEMLLAKIGQYEKVRQFHEHSPHPSLQELIEGGRRPSVAIRDARAIDNFHKRLETLDMAFKKKIKKTRLSGVLRN